MKKLISMMLLVAMLVSSFLTTSVYADEGIKIVINGVEQIYDQMPVISNGRTLVPMRGIFEALGAEVEWIDATDTVVGSRDRQYIKLRLDSDTVYINGIEQEKKLDVPATIVNGRTMVPVRFIAETLGETVEWDDATRTVKITSDYLNKVAVSDKLAVLPSTMHRPIPTEFTRSNDWNDLIFYGEEEENAAKTIDIINQLQQGVDILSADDFLTLASFEKGKKVTETPYGKLEEITVEGQNFTKAIRVTTATVPEKTNLHVLDFGRIGEGKVNAGDNILFTCKARLVDGGTNGIGSIWSSFQEVVTFKKSIWKEFFVSEKWQTFYFSGVAGENHDHLEIRFGYCDAPQTIEIADVRLINYGPEIIGDNALPSFDGTSRDSIKEGAPWRKDAIERIKEIRMGDFKVVVKDEAGNVIPNAEVNFDMFESAIPLGSTINRKTYGIQDEQKYFSSFFNSGVLEHNMKWGPYEEDNGKFAREIVNSARDLGMIYLRGHVMIFDYPITPSGTVLLPNDLVENYGNEDFVDIRVKNWIYQVSDDFAGEIYEWDVANELIGREEKSSGSIYANMGYQYYNKIFKWAREVNPESKLFLVDGRRIFDSEQRFVKIADNLYSNENRFNALGIQSHHSSIWMNPEDLDALYTRLAEKYNCTISLTEYTQEFGDDVYNGNYTRDFMISALANKYINGICLWNFSKTKTDVDPVMMTPEYELTKGGEQLIDIFYNKMWTHDAKATTDASGVGQVRGYYGNYDVTVTANGKTKTVMAAFHPGYENVLEITLK